MPAKRRPAPTPVTRYAPAARLHGLRAMLDAVEGVSIYDVAERFGVAPRTALRYVQALARAGEPLYDEMSGRRKVWRLMPTARRQSITLTTAQMVALFLSRRVFDFLAGTGFKEDLDDVFAKLEATLRRKDAAAVRDLDRKVFDVNEARHLYEGRIEDVNDIMTALLREERLRVTHEGVAGGAGRSAGGAGSSTAGAGRSAGAGGPDAKLAPFVIEPYSLLVYKKGLYLAGRSERHGGEVRTFALDGFREVEWLRGNKFEVPAGWRPEQITEGAFGLIRGKEATRVRVWFDDKVARYVQRRMWHPTQRFSKTRAPRGGIEMTMDVRGTVEVVSWVLGFGATAEVLEPPALRAAVAAELAEGARRYGRRSAPTR